MVLQNFDGRFTPKFGSITIRLEQESQDGEVLVEKLVSVARTVLLGVLSGVAIAQEVVIDVASDTGEPRTLRAEFFGQSDPAPSWAVWAAFYRHLQYQASQSAGLPISVLKSRVGIGEDLADHVMYLGRDYLQSLQRLQEESRRNSGLATVVVPP